MAAQVAPLSMLFRMTHCAPATAAKSGVTVVTVVTVAPDPGEADAVSSGRFCPARAPSKVMV